MSAAPATGISSWENPGSSPGRDDAVGTNSLLAGADVDGVSLAFLFAMSGFSISNFIYI
jgi:hypothetical protein